MGESNDGLVSVVHSHPNTAISFELVDLKSLLLSLFWSEAHFELAWPTSNEVSGLVLVSESVTSDDDGFFPAWDESWDVADEDWFSEDSSIELVSDGPIWGLPHLLEVVLLDSGFIWGDGGCSSETNRD